MYQIDDDAVVEAENLLMRRYKILNSILNKNTWILI